MKKDKGRRRKILLTVMMLLLLTGVCLWGIPQLIRFLSPTEKNDYASLVSPSEDTLQYRVRLELAIDGDTARFVGEPLTPSFSGEQSRHYVRFLAIDCPENTQTVEPYGRAAAEFTKEKLTNASEILLEADGDKLWRDKTGTRVLTWVWYKTEGGGWRNLNIELLEEGLAERTTFRIDHYKEECDRAEQKAKAEKRGLWSGRPDPSYYYGDAAEISLTELRCHIDRYVDRRVAFTGLVTAVSEDICYVQSTASGSELSAGIVVYFGHGLSEEGRAVLAPGNVVRIVGRVQYYEPFGTYQISDLSYSGNKKDPDSILLLEKGTEVNFVPMSPELLVNTALTVALEEDSVTLPLREFMLGTAVLIRDVTVKSAYTTYSSGSSYGAVTLHCEAKTVSYGSSRSVSLDLRTVPLWETDENGQRTLVKAERFVGKTFDVRGLVDAYKGELQIKILETEWLSEKESSSK